MVQAWRLADWEPGVYTIVRFSLTPEGTGTRVMVDQDGCPASFKEVLANTWRLLYFEPMARHFSRSMAEQPGERKENQSDSPQC